MPKASDSDVVAGYVRRFSDKQTHLKCPPQPDLRQVVVIPVYDEPDLLECLNSLYQCARPAGATEVILVFNASSDAPTPVLEQNEICRSNAENWIANHADRQMQFHVMWFEALPRKHAGVGWARKLGMDEAAFRLHAAGNLSNGLIICFDADCTCAPNLLTANQHHFEQHPGSAACSTFYQHPLSGSYSTEHYLAIAAYELHLRYYVEALRWAGFPYAKHTIGSSMSVRARSYLEHGGMNRRKAGEDFYFLNKLMVHTQVTELNETTVYPSVRPSHRVPFGTGKAIQATLDGQTQTTYAFEAFRELKAWLTRIAALESIPEESIAKLTAPLPSHIASFLYSQDIEDASKVIARNVADFQQYQRRLYQWFDGFRCMKFMNWVSESHYPKVPVEHAACEPSILGESHFPGKEWDTFTLLEAYRQKQRTTNWAENR